MSWLPIKGIIPLIDPIILSFPSFPDTVDADMAIAKTMCELVGKLTKNFTYLSETTKRKK